MKVFARVAALEAEAKTSRKERELQRRELAQMTRNFNALKVSSEVLQAESKQQVQKL